MYLSEQATKENQKSVIVQHYTSTAKRWSNINAAFKFHTKLVHGKLQAEFEINILGFQQVVFFY